VSCAAGKKRTRTVGDNSFAWLLPAYAEMDRTSTAEKNCLGKEIGYGSRHIRKDTMGIDRERRKGKLVDRPESVRSQKAKRYDGTMREVNRCGGQGVAKR